MLFKAFSEGQQKVSPRNVQKMFRILGLSCPGGEGVAQPVPAQQLKQLLSTAGCEPV